MMVELINLEEQGIRRMTKRECAVERIETLAHIARHSSTPFAASIKLVEAQERAVDAGLMTWEEADAIADAVYFA